MRYCSLCGKIFYPILYFDKVFICKECKNKGHTKKEAENEFNKTFKEHFGYNSGEPPNYKVFIDSGKFIRAKDFKEAEKKAKELFKEETRVEFWSLDS